MDWVAAGGTDAGGDVAADREGREDREDQTVEADQLDGQVLQAPASSASVLVDRPREAGQDS